MPVVLTLVPWFLIVNNQASGGRPAATSAATSRTPPTVGFIHDPEAFDGAGCSLWLLTDNTYSARRSIFVSDFDGNAAVNINRRDWALRLVTSEEPKGAPRKGDHSTFRYHSGGIEVIIKYIVTGTCAPNDESCEVTYYNATVVIRAPTGARVLSAHGLCGS